MQTDKNTDTQTTLHATSVALGRINVLRSCDAAEKNANVAEKHKINYALSVVKYEVL